MRSFATTSTLALAIAAFGCSADTRDPFEQAALEVEQVAAALSDDEADESVDELADGDRREHRRGHRHHRRLLAGFGDSEAMQACRELRASCADAEDETCRQDVRQCVHAALEDAFAAMCEERTAMCEAEEAPARPCERIAERCAEGPRFPHRMHGPGDGMRPDFGAGRPGHDRGDRGDHDADDGDDGDDDGDDDDGGEETDTDDDGGEETDTEETDTEEASA